MSFTDEYLAQKKKKKKSETTGHSFTDEYLNSRKTQVPEEDDIAPVLTTPKKETKKEERTWFDSGAFDDGYQFGDVTKTLLGTTHDITENLATGVIGMGEKIVDAFAYLAPAFNVSQQAQNSLNYSFDIEQYRKEQKAIGEFIKKDLYDERKVADALLNPTGSTMSQDWSVLGGKSDSLVQSAGQLAATFGLQAVGVPWFVTSGVTSFGSETENALNQNATYDQAGVSAAITAGAEILTEKLFGGDLFVKSAGADIATKVLATNISNKALRTLAKLGIDVTGEGFEEVASQAISRLGSSLYKKEDAGEILFNEEALDEYIESFLGGVVLGGGMSGINVAKSAGTDYTTGLTKNEQAVFDKVYSEAVAQAEKDGKLTQKEKNKIYDDVMNDMEKGYISTDIIEEVLGGDSYKTYKDIVDSEDSLTKQEKELSEEFKTLNGMVWQEMTGEQHDRREELRDQLKGIREQIKSNEQNSQRNLLKAQLSKDVYELSKGDRLVESYFEQVRSKQKYTADLSKYEGRARDVIQKVMESELADNTNRTHDFWDWVAKMASDLDTDITLATNEEILEMVKAEHEAEGKEFDASKFEGQIIDGFASKNGIAINASTQRALNFVVGHEVTHKLEKTKHYKSLQKLLLEYAKDEYKSRYDSRAGQYKGKYASDGKFKSKIDQEVTSDLVGDYLFTDKGFIDHLTKDRNVFQRVWDEVKYMAKIATAGSEQARQLEKVKREFERAYREANKQDSDGVQLSVSDSKTDADYLDAVNRGDMETAQKMVDEKADAYLNEMLLKNDNDEVGFKYHRGETPTKTFKRYAVFNVSPDGFRAAYAGNKNPTPVGVWLDAQNLQSYVSDVTQFQDGTFASYIPGDTGFSFDKKFSPELKAEMMEQYGLKSGQRFLLERGGKHSSDVPNFSQMNLKQDENGNKVTSPKDGALPHNKLIFEIEYGTSDDGNLTEYVKEHGRIDAMGKNQGLAKIAPNQFYDFKTNPNAVGNWGIGGTFRIVRLVDMDEIVSRTMSFKQEQIEAAEQAYNAGEISKKDRDARIKGANAITVQKWVGGYHPEDFGLSVDVVNDLYQQGQKMKLTDAVTYDDNGNVIPLSERFNAEKNDIRYSLSDSDGKQLSKEQQDYFKDSKVRDENGNLKVMYHGTSKGGFTVFDTYGSNYGLFGTGSYFTDSKSIAESYTNKGKGSNKQVYESYLNITNPMDMDAQANPAEWAKAFPDADFPESGTNEDFYRAVEEFYADQWMPKWEVAEEIQGGIEYGMGYDGITHIGGGRVNPDGEKHRVYIAFDPEQIKNTDNVNPTENPDIRYSVSEETDKNYLDAVNRGDTETAQKMVDEALENSGFAVRGHHGTTNLFYVFDTAKSNIENDWGRGIYATTSEEDAQVNYASEDGADLTNRIERLAEMMENWDEYEDMDYEQRVEAARNQLSQGENRMLHVAYRMENPVVVERGNGGTFFTYESEYDEELDEYSEPSGTLIDVVEHMKDIIYEDYEWASYDADKLDNIYEEAMDWGGISASELQSLVSDWLVDVADEDGNLASNEILRAAFEQMGFDGIVDKTVPYKFGALSGKRYGGMRGVVEGTTHFIAFNSSQVKLTDPVTYDDSGNVIPLSERFNPDKEDIRYSVSETDKTYADAVKNRDWDTAQKLVDKAAKKAGYKKAVYHGTESRFTVFDTDEESTTRPGHVWDAEYPDGTIFLAEDYNVASYYGDHVMEMYLDTTGMKVFKEPNMYAHRAMDDKYAYEVYNYPVIAVKGKDMTIYATLDNTLVKSSDAATYDDNGELIPLSERFKHSDPDIRYSLSSMANTFFGDENMTAEQFKKADYRQTQGYQVYVDQCLNNYRQTRADFNESTARKSIEDSIDGIVRVAIAAKQAGYDIYDDASKRSQKDSKNRLLFSSLEPNSDYFTSNDISTICDKRKNFAEIYDDIVRAEEAKGVPKGKRFFDNVDNYFYLHKLMADKGLTQPCRQCYVESMRKNLAPMANAFLRLVQEANPDNTANDQLYHQKGKQKGELKTSNASTREFVLSALAAHPEYNMSVSDLTIETLTTEDGLAQLKLQAPLIYEAFNSFYGQSKPKMPKSATPFRFGELTALLTDEKGKIKKSLVDKINSTGGFRLQSYSDFQIQNYTDVLQVLFEAGTLGLNGHAYTKVPAFLDATAGTNLKRNISIFMYKDGDEWKLDKNDSFPYDLDEIYDIVKADKSGNTGIIAVSQNADMSAWIMANDYVGYGIPFHKSGLKMGTVRNTDVKTDDGRVIKGYSGTIDHTKQQTEVWKEELKDSEGKVVHKAKTKVKNGINIYSFWDFDNKSNLSKNELIEKNVKAYIDQCELAGYLPKFRDYVMNNDKVLNDVLKYSKKLGFVSEDATIGDISFQYKGYTIPYGYYKFLGDFGMFTPDGKASAQKTLSLDNYDFDKAVKFFSDSETLRRNEILQQFANGEERQKYKDSNLTAGELQDIVKRKRSEVAKDVVGDLAPAMSISDIGEQHKEYGRYNVYAKDMLLNPQEVAPVAKTESVAETAPVAISKMETTTEDLFPDDLAPMDETAEQERLASLDDADAPLEAERHYDSQPDTTPIGKKDIADIANEAKVTLALKSKQMGDFRKLIEEYSRSDNPSREQLFRDIKDNFGTYDTRDFDQTISDAKKYLRTTKLYLSDTIIGDVADFSDFKKRNRGKVILSANGGLPVDIAYQELNSLYPHLFPESISNPTDQLLQIVDVANKSSTVWNKNPIDDNTLWEAASDIADNVAEMKRIQKESYANEDSLEAFTDLVAHGDEYAPMDEVAPAIEEVTEATEDVAPVPEAYEAIRPKPKKQPKVVRADDAAPAYGEKLLRVDSNNGRPGEKQRKWVGTSTESDAVDGKVLPDDLDQDMIHYRPIPNRKTLGNANAKLDNMGYESSLVYFKSQLSSSKVSLDDIALGERLVQEAVKKGDTKTAGELIMDISILGTELGQKVQALSIIKRLTPEGQLKMLQKTVERGKTKKDKAFEGVELTQEMIDKILSVYNSDGTYDQEYLNEMVEDVKQQIADQMKVTTMDVINEWRYLSMLGNPKTHIRNIVSNAAMWATRKAKNALARTIEDIAPVKERSKTRKKASDDVKAYAEKETAKLYEDNTENKYSESGSIKAKRTILKPGALDKASKFNSKALSAEDTFFSKPAYRSALSEYLTANGITTHEDIKKNPEIVAKAKQYAEQQAKEATFQQDSYIASKISEIERKNPVLNVAIGSVLPFKKTPINIAKTAAAYSPLGFARNIYDAVQVSKGNMEASEAIDHLAQTLTGTSLSLIGYALASMGYLNGAGNDDKEGEYDYQLGKQSYSFNFNGDTYSLSWLSPVAMPLFVGANAYEQLVEDKDWDWNVVSEALAQTLDPLSEMSFLSSLSSVLSSYDSGMAAFGGMIESASQSYITSLVPTLSSQVAQVLDDKKRSTKISANSGFDFGEETWNKIKYKIPGLRNTLEASTDIWGNEIKQTENVLAKAIETFIAPYARREDIATAVDEEIKELYSQTGDTGLIPSIPNNYVSYDGNKYEMSASEYTSFKKMYGQTALDLMEQLFDTETYQDADSETRADMVNRVYDYARDEARKAYFANLDIDFTNATEDGEEVYKEDPIKGAIEADLPVDEYVFSEEYPAKYSFFKQNGISYRTYAEADEDGKRAYSWAYENPGKYTMSKAIADDFLTYYQYRSDCNDFDAKDENGETVSGLKKERVIEYINNLDIDYGSRIILFRSMYDSKDDCATYNADIVDYLNSRDDISYEEMETILKELGFKVSSDGTITWD